MLLLVSLLLSVLGRSQGSSQCDGAFVISSFRQEQVIIRPIQRRYANRRLAPTPSMSRKRHGGVNSCRSWAAPLKEGYDPSPDIRKPLDAFNNSSIDIYDSVAESDCPRGYYLDSVQNSCSKLGPLGTLSQVVETAGPLKNVYQQICNLFGYDPKQLSNLGVGFALSYAIVSTINGSISLSAAWYLSCKRTGLSPLSPGQWKSLLAAYGSMYAVIQLLRPFRVAAAVAMSKCSKEFLEQTQSRLNVSRGVAIFFQYALGWITWLGLTAVGVTWASCATGVPILG